MIQLQQLQTCCFLFLLELKIETINIVILISNVARFQSDTTWSRIETKPTPWLDLSLKFITRRPWARETQITLVCVQFSVGHQHTNTLDIFPSPFAYD